MKHLAKRAPVKSCFTMRSTPFGPVTVLWSVETEQPKISRVLLSRPGVSAKGEVSVLLSDSTRCSCSEIDVVADRIGAFLNGEDIRFSLGVVCMDGCSEFQQHVLRAEHGIPRGSVSTYQRIAMHMGCRNGARAIGNALAKNPFPIIIPCHRAIRTDRSLGGYQGGLGMQRSLLEMEGIGFDDSGRVVTEGFFY